MMNDISSENPTSTLMVTSGASLTIQTLQQIKDHVFQAATKFSEIKSPEAAFEEVNALIQECFHLLREQRESGDEQTIQDKIVRYAGDRRILDIHRADAEKAYTCQIETILQSLCDELILAMGSAVVKRSLQKLPAEKLKQYLPDNLLPSNDAFATELETVPSPTDLDEPHGDKSIRGVLDPLRNKKRCASVDTNQFPAKKRPINSSQEDVNEQERPIQQQNVIDSTTRCSREQCGAGANTRVDTNTNIRQSGSGISIADRSSGFVAGVGSASDQPSRNTPLGASISPSAEYLVTADEDNHNITQHVVVVRVNDADDNCIGFIKQTGPWNNGRVDTMLQKTILRPVRIRRGRDFTENHLTAVSDRSDAKGVKIVSCMIQATGDVMNQRCQLCEKYQGVFEECIKVNDGLFRRCGNCEWNQKRCQGSSINAKPASCSPSSERSRRNRNPQHTKSKDLNTFGQPGGSSPAQSQPQNLAEGQMLPRAVGPMPTRPCEVSQVVSVAGASPILASDTPHESWPASDKAQTMPRAESVHDETQSDGFSDTDSYTGAPVTENDWRILQVRTRFFTSAESVTQYWSWVEEEKCFEHQVLKETRPVQWGVLRKPIDFDVRLKEISEVRYSAEALRVYLVMGKENATMSTQDKAPRGDVAVVFKNEKTVQRFVRFCHKRSLSVTKQKPDVMVNAWRNMKSEVALSDDDDDTS